MNKLSNSVSIIGCGFLGKKIASELQQQGESVTGYVRSKQSVHDCEEQNIDCQRIDLDEVSSVTSYDFNDKHIIYLVDHEPVQGSTAP